MKKSVLIALSMFFYCIVFSQTIIYVTPSGAGAMNGSSWPNASPAGQLQAKIDGATANTQIWIAAGTYTAAAYPTGSSGGITWNNFAFSLKDGVSLYGGFSGSETSLSQRNITANPTILTGHDTYGSPGLTSYDVYYTYHTIVCANAGAGTALDGLTLQRYVAADLYHVAAGNVNAIADAQGYITIGGTQITNGYGGILYSLNSNITINNCTFQYGNAAYEDLHYPVSNNLFGRGGAIYNSGSSPTIKNCVFKDNYAPLGGVMYNDYQSSPVIDSCSFSGGGASYYGGSIYNYISSPSITNCSFTGGSIGHGSGDPASGQNGGGAIYNSQSSPTISKCTFSGLSASVNINYTQFGYGGAIFNDNGSAGSITGCLFQGNSASGGGAICNMNSSPVITNSLFIGNGGGYISNTNTYVDFDDGNAVLSKGGSPSVINCTFDGTQGSGFAAITFIGVNSTSVIKNCIVNGVSIQASVQTIMSHNFMDSYYFNGQSQATVPGTANTRRQLTGIYKGGAVFGADNIFGTADDGYMPSCQGGAVNAGITGTNVPAVDITGTARAGNPDLGAYENTTASNSAAPVLTISTPYNNTCLGAPVTFTASLTSAGSTPAYTWYKNGEQVPVNGNTYTDSTLVNGDSVYATAVASQEVCVANPNATSNVLYPTFAPSKTPSITISSNAGSILCYGKLISFTAAITNGGTKPLYKWLKNGKKVGTNASTYADSTLTFRDTVSCQLTSNITGDCVRYNVVKSNSLTINIGDRVPLYVNITPVEGTILCGTNNTTIHSDGNFLILTHLQWYLNGSPVTGNGYDFFTTVSNGDSIYAVSTIDPAVQGCVLNQSAASNVLKYTVYAASLHPTLSISANAASPVCAGTSVTFTAAVTNTVNPSYQWKKNNINVGTNSPAYIDNSLANGDVITCTLTDILPCTGFAAASSNSLKFTVTPLVTPSVSITASVASPVCAGTLVKFTATATNGGAGPTYQWYKNDIATGTNNRLYSDAALNDGDTVRCVLTGAANCSMPASVSSNVMAYAVNPKLTPTLGVTTNTGTTICAGTPVTFTATAANTGNSAKYQWKKNNVKVGTNSRTYTDAGLNNGDSVACQLTVTAACATPATITSKAAKFNVTALSAPSISITSSVASPICAGTTVRFTATATNVGVGPVYQWYKNGAAVGTGTKTYPDAALKDKDSVWCVVTSPASCLTTNTARSNVLVYAVNPKLSPKLTVSTNTATTICAGTPVTFTATATNAGGNPTYQWKKNNRKVGTGSTTYTDNALQTGDSVTCTLTVTALCATPAVVTAKAVKFIVNPSATMSVSITATVPSPICAGTQVKFTATALNVGIGATYQWYKNKNAVGAGTKVYSDATLANGDSVWCVVTSSASCLTANTAGSNVLVYAVNPKLSPKLTVSANTATTICAGTPVTFTATATNAGGNPTYQWKKNNRKVGTGSTTYTDNALQTGDSVTCILTVTALCATPAVVTAKAVKFIVNPLATLSVSIAATVPSPICAGTQVKFTATAVNAGAGPTYQWYKNKKAAGTNARTYLDSAIKNKDSVWCIVTGTASCLTANTAKSNILKYVVNPKLAPTLTVTANTGTSICTGTKVTFTATVANTGASPQYQWKKNGVNTGVNSKTYTDSLLNNSDTVYCVLTVTAPCATPASITSAKLKFIVTSAVPALPSVITGPASVTSGQAGLVYSVRVSAGVTNTWTVPAGVTIVSGQGTNTLTVNWGTAGGSISVTANNGCGASAPRTLAVTVPAGLAGYNAKDPLTGGAYIKMYPNPVTSIVTVEFTAGIENKYEAQVINSLGQVLTSKSSFTVVGLNVVSFDMAGYASAMYYIRLLDKEHGVRILKVVKAK